jgi:two-component system, OmpR family, KDP operon response regulator KdpE
MTPITVLVVEDQESIRRFLRASLVGAGYRVVEAGTAATALRTASESPPDLVILDLGLPDRDGFEVLRGFRSWSQAPLIVLSARDGEASKVAALDAGADDYVTKPFGVGELLARMRSALRHRSPGSGDDAIVADQLRIDVAARRVYVGGNEIHLTPLEYKLLLTLAKSPGRVLTHRALLREVWGPDATEEVHYLRVFVASLRRKVEADATRPRLIVTEPGVGYRFTDV